MGKKSRATKQDAFICAVYLFAFFITNCSWNAGQIYFHTFRKCFRISVELFLFSVKDIAKLQPQCLFFVPMGEMNFNCVACTVGEADAFLSVNIYNISS